MTRPRVITAALLFALAAPASAIAADGKSEGRDYTVEIMIGLIVFLMVAMIVIGILEQRKGH